MMKHYRPGYDSHEKRFKVFVTETPVLITHLRPAEQIAACEALVSKAPANKIQDCYVLLLATLKSVHENIALSETKVYVDARGKELMAESEEESAEPWSEGRKKDEAFWAYKKAVDERKMWMACERAVRRLLGRCEELEKEETARKGSLAGK